MPEIVTQVLALLFVLLLIVAAIVAVTISFRHRSVAGTDRDRARYAGELIKLEDELDYAAAFADAGSGLGANIGRARAELSAAFALYTNSANQNDSQLSANDSQAIAAHIARVKQLLANPIASNEPYLPRNTTIIVNNEIKPVIGQGSKVFEVALWVLGIVPGLVLLAKKAKARNYFAALEQRIRATAAQIDVYLEQRAEILAGVAALTPLTVTYSAQRNYTSGQLDRAYQELERNAGAGVPVTPEIANALKANRRVEREITAARTLYNDTVGLWNADIFMWPTKMMVACEDGLKTKPLFVTSDIARAIDNGGTVQW